MDIVAENLSKRFNREWIFKNLSQVFQQNNSYAITGPNGSGKSTLLQVLSGIIPCSTGSILYQQDAKIVKEEDFYKHLSVTTPYQELIEEFTLLEFLEFHLRFKPLRAEMKPLQLAEQLYLQDSLHKEIRNFSSGMKQRVKLALSLYSDSPIVFLDEPTTNLDTKGIDWYLKEVDQMRSGILLLVCSNQAYEYSFCTNHLSISDFK